MRRALLTLAVLCVTCAAASDSTLLRLVATVDLPKYSGDFDHFAADVNGNRLFLAAEDHGTLEVFDLKSTRWLRTIRGFEVPHSILYLPASQKLLVTDGRGFARLRSGQAPGLCGYRGQRRTNEGVGAFGNRYEGL